MFSPGVSIPNNVSQKHRCTRARRFIFPACFSKVSPCYVQSAMMSVVSLAEMTSSTAFGAFVIESEVAFLPESIRQKMSDNSVAIVCGGPDARTGGVDTEISLVKGPSYVP